MTETNKMFALLYLRILTEGAVIKRYISNEGKEEWSIMGDFKKQSKVKLPFEWEFMPFTEFSSEKGAIGWCHRKKIKINRIEK